MDEHIRAMRTIWADDIAEYDGEHVQFGPLHSWPKPQQRPGPPILVGGSGNGALRRVLEYGTEWGDMPAADLQARIAALHTASIEQSRVDPIPVTLFDAPRTAHELDVYREGVTRALIFVPSTDPDTALTRLDKLSTLMTEA